MELLGSRGLVNESWVSVPEVRSRKSGGCITIRGMNIEGNGVVIIDARYGLQEWKRIHVVVAAKSGRGKRGSSLFDALKLGDVSCNTV